MFMAHWQNTVIVRLSGAKIPTIVAIHPFYLMRVHGAIDDFGFRLQLVEQISPTRSVRVGGGFGARLWHLQHHKIRVRSPLNCHHPFFVTCQISSKASIRISRHVM